MHIILNKAKKDFLKYANKPTINSIFNIKGFISYFLLRNFYPSIKDLLFYFSDLLELYLIYYFLGKEYTSIGIVSIVLFRLINIVVKVVSYSLREKILTLININKKNIINKYFSSTLASVIIVFIVCIFVLNSTFDFKNNIIKIIFINKLASSIFLTISTLYFQSTYVVSRVFFNLYYVAFIKALGLSFIYYSFSSINYFAFIIFFYLDSLSQLLITYYYCKKVLFINNMNLFSNRLKDYFKHLFWFFKNSKIKFILRFTSLFLSNSQSLIFILIIFFYFPNYLFIFFILYQIFNFFLILSNRVSKSMFFDVARQSYLRNKIILNKLILNNLFVVLIISVINIILFSKLDLITNIYPKWETIYTNLFILNKWQGLYLLVFFNSINNFFIKFLEFSESHLINIFIHILNYLLIYFYIVNDNYFIQSQNPVCFFYIFGYVNFFIFLSLVFVFIFNMSFKKSFLFNLKKPSIVFSNIDDFFNKKAFYYLFTLNNKYYKKFEILHSLLKDKSIGVFKITYNTYIFSFSNTLKEKTLKNYIYSNTSFLCDQIVLLNNKPLNVILEEHKYFLAYMYPKFFEFSNSSFKYNRVNLLDELNKNNITYTVYKKIHKNFKLLKFFNNLLIPDHLIFKDNNFGLIPVYVDLKLENIIKIKSNKSDLIKKYYKLLIVNLIHDFLEKVNKD